MGSAVHISSLDRVGERVLDHLRQRHHTALVGSPGCGMTTFLSHLTAKMVDSGFAVHEFDARTMARAELVRELNAERPGDAPQRVVVLDHLGQLRSDDYRKSLTSITECVANTGDLCLWCGNIDVRGVHHQLGLKLCSVPSAHVSFPIVTRDELLAAYRALAGERGGAHVCFPILTRDELTAAYRTIASEQGCRWGDAVLYLMLDVCGTDLALVRSATDYLHGEWSDRIYDESVWDRLQEWLTDDDAVDAYRTRLSALPSSCETTLALIRFGGKPQCLRAELVEEVDEGLRRLCLDGFIVPNLLPGFYQLRNLVVRFLLDESVPPEVLFRRATNERAGALLQDAETTLRHVLATVFARIGVDAARQRLEAMQQPGEVIDKELNRALLKWAKENCSEEAVRDFNELVLQHRSTYKKVRSVWASTTDMMLQDGNADDNAHHISRIDYLTFDQLGHLVLNLKNEVFPDLNDSRASERRRQPKYRCTSEPSDLIGNWRADVAKIRRLRNQVAHLRNVGFQDMEDLARTLERMRTDLILYGGVSDPHIVTENAECPAAANTE